MAHMESSESYLLKSVLPSDVWVQRFELMLSGLATATFT